MSPSSKKGYRKIQEPAYLPLGNIQRDTSQKKTRHGSCESTQKLNGQQSSQATTQTETSQHEEDPQSLLRDYQNMLEEDLEEDNRSAQTSSANNGSLAAPTSHLGSRSASGPLAEPCVTSQAELPLTNLESVFSYSEPTIPWTNGSLDSATRENISTVYPSSELGRLAFSPCDQIWDDTFGKGSLDMLLHPNIIDTILENVDLDGMAFDQWAPEYPT